MRSAISAIVALLAGVTLLTAANALLGTLVSVRMAIEHFPRPVSGLVMSGYFAGFVLGSLYAPRVINRVGHIRAFAAFAATLGIATTVHPFAVSPVPWLALRVLVGWAVAGELMVAESWLNTAAQSVNRAQVFSLYVIAVYLAFGAGQLVLAFGHPAGLDLFLVVALLLSTSILPIVLTRAPAPVVPERTGSEWRHVWQRAPIGMAGALVSGLAVGAVQAIGPQYASELGLSVARISQFMAAFFLSGILLQWPVGRLSDRLDRRAVLAVMALATALLCVAIAILERRSYGLLIGLAILTGASAATLYPLAVAHANDRLADGNVVTVTATLLLTYGIGAAGGPLIATTLMTRAGAAGLFYAAAAPCLMLAAYTAMRIVRYERVEQLRFASVAHTTPVVLHLDPRGTHPGSK